MSAPVIDPFSLEVLDDPYDTYARLREQSAVYTVADLGVHLVLSHAAVLDAIARPHDFSSNLTAFFMVDDNGRQVLIEASGGGGTDVLATADDPAHAIHRKSLNRPFGVPRMADLEPQLRAMVAELLAARVPTGHIEWVAGLSGMLPIRAIALVLGLPDGDAPRLKFWSDEGIEVLSGFADAARMAECTAHIAEFAQYLVAALAAPSGGVLGTIAGAVASGDYDEATAIGILVQLVGAGSDSTTGLTGSCALALATHPDVQRALRDDPALVPLFVEEVLRLETPFRGHFRHVLRDTSIAGVDVRAGERLLLMWSAANRDPAVFDRPDELDLGRRAREHLGFGWGIHHCIGAPLARLEARLAVEELLARTREVRLDPDAPPPRWVPSLFLRRLAELHLQVTPA
jgi:cytochrome P450 family 144